mgnify:CR=1 FL=1
MPTYHHLFQYSEYSINMEKEEQIHEQLSEVIDPEFNINIVDLGLIRETEFEDSEAYVKLTLTSKGCPFHGVFSEVITDELTENLDFVESVETELTFDPPWDPDDMTDKARRKFGSIPGRSAF